MRHTGRLNVFLASAALVLTNPAVATDCEGQWEPSMFGTALSHPVVALEVFDDGDGPALYAAGLFTSAGGVAANRIAKWDGQAWSPLGLGVNDDVNDLAVFDDGTGEALYVGGRFTNAGGQPIRYLARWDGEEWTEVGGGISGANFYVSSLTVCDTGDGPALYVSGYFGNAGGVPALRIARWDGENWSNLGSGLGGVALALACGDVGDGPALYAVGNFSTAGGSSANRVARWNGSSWSNLGSGLDAITRAAIVCDLGDGMRLYIGGQFSTAGGQPINRIASWDGHEYAALGNGLAEQVFALAEFDDGSGPALFVGGSFDLFNVGYRITKWDGSAFTPLGAGMSGTVHALAVSSAPGGDVLAAGGSFTNAGGNPSQRIAMWYPPGEVPSIEQQPQSLHIQAGEPAVLSVGASGSEPLTYQWRYEGQPLEDPGPKQNIEGSSSSTLVIDPAQESDSGDYDVVITNSCGEVVSQAAELVVKPDSTTPGDLNNDGVVNVGDMLMLLSAWGPCPKVGSCQADLAGNGSVSVGDLLILLSNWG